MDVLVIGAGVSGLTTGICLAEAGLDVRIRTDVPPDQTTSAAAGALWGLVRSGPRERVLGWGQAGLAVLSKLAAEPGTGVRMASGRAVSREPGGPPYWAGLLSALRPCRPDELPEGCGGGWHYTAPLATMPAYLGYLRARFERAGGTLELAPPVRSLAELAGAAPVMVNCTGAAARHLVPDPALVPIRGQVVLVANPGIEEFFIGEDIVPPPWIVYMFPHGDTVLLGGTNQEGDEDKKPQNQIAERIVAHCARIEPRLRGATVVGHRVGLRPYRAEVRLESEPSGAGVLWHNYGHGGAGISLTWGCAAEVTAGVLARLSRIQLRRVVQLRCQPGGRDDPVGVLAQLGDLGPVHRSVQADPDPAAVADVRRPEEPVRVGPDQFLLRPWRRRAPQVREVLGMVPVGPQRHERALAPDEPGRRAVAGPFGHLGQCQADRAHPPGQVMFLHLPNLGC
jgi:D-amino-acid oxidase